MGKVAWSSDAASQMLRLKDHLFDDYDGLVRPVKDGISTTIVTYRMLLYALLDMSWIDEFLTWNATEFGGIEVIHVPAERVWLPDITLHQNADDIFERYKPNTYVNVFYDGLVIWYVPTIFGSSCRQRVRYFPFDTQICDMTLSSWAYDGNHIEIQAEAGADSEQSR
ncbi:acetylcholine receptor subunit alpha-type unc-63-like [Amphiura filiformis]|uniref:acetylcholine receptor subunit alpha-type unc-63-like n=1 Tax=Amphiura filiformis TaxID=82378 RepID=UPI003B226820